MRRRLLRITMFAMIVLAGSFVVAQESNAEVDESPTYFGVIACDIGSRGILPDRGACFVKRRVFTIENLEISLGGDVQAKLNPLEAYLGGYIVFDYYGPTWSAFLEIMTPNIIPPHGVGDRWRVGFTLAF